jgi:hypothetical protein
MKSLILKRTLIVISILLLGFKVTVSSAKSQNISPPNHGDTTRTMEGFISPKINAGIRYKIALLKHKNQKDIYLINEASGCLYKLVSQTKNTKINPIRVYFSINKTSSSACKSIMKSGLDSYTSLEMTVCEGTSCQYDQVRLFSENQLVALELTGKLKRLIAPTIKKSVQTQKVQQSKSKLIVKKQSKQKIAKATKKKTPIKKYQPNRILSINGFYKVSNSGISQLKRDRYKNGIESYTEYMVQPTSYNAQSFKVGQKHGIGKWYKDSQQMNHRGTMFKNHCNDGWQRFYRWSPTYIEVKSRKSNKPSGVWKQTTRYAKVRHSGRVCMTEMIDTRTCKVQYCARWSDDPIYGKRENYLVRDRALAFRLFNNIEKWTKKQLTIKGKKRNLGGYDSRKESYERMQRIVDDYVRGLY